MASNPSDFGYSWSMNYYSIVKSPIRDLMLVADDSALVGLYFVGSAYIPAESRKWIRKPKHPVLHKAAKQLKEYFAGQRKNFSLPLRLDGTDFQKNVWREIARIPFGETIHYGELAKRAGKPRAVRAAGSNTGRNPIAVIIPCHRVIGKDGGLGGFGGGLERKRRLLAIESPDVITAKKKSR